MTDSSELNLPTVIDHVKAALSEDLGIGGDITTRAINSKVDFSIIAREQCIVSGTFVASILLDCIKANNVILDIVIPDSETANPGDAIIRGRGSAKDVLAIERTLLNYMQHMSGVATITSKFVECTKAYKAQVCDTRKTIPLLRILQKYSVRCGGGTNHRYALDQAILIKDNHIAACGGIEEAILRFKHKGFYTHKIIVECDSISNVEAALYHKVDAIMLDNMNISEISAAVNIIRDQCVIEASGEVGLHNVEAIAATGVDYISVGSITHSVRSINMSMEIRGSL